MRKRVNFLVPENEFVSMSVLSDVTGTNITAVYDGVIKLCKLFVSRFNPWKKPLTLLWEASIGFISDDLTGELNQIKRSLVF